MSKMDKIANEVTAQITHAENVPAGLLRTFTRLSDLVQEAYVAGYEDGVAAERVASEVGHKHHATGCQCMSCAHKGL